MTTDKQKEVTLYTDGACSGNPGPGGWAYILEYKGHEKECSGFDPDTTNNRMELSAVIEGLSALKEPCTVQVYTDSQYVCSAFTEKWVYGWIKRGWHNSQGKPTPNKDLWLKLLNLTKRHTVFFHKVRGHAGNPKNERCDKLAVTAIKHRENK